MLGYLWILVDSSSQIMHRAITKALETLCVNGHCENAWTVGADGKAKIKKYISQTQILHEQDTTVDMLLWGIYNYLEI